MEGQNIFPKDFVFPTHLGRSSWMDLQDGSFSCQIELVVVKTLRFRTRLLEWIPTFSLLSANMIQHISSPSMCHEGQTWSFLLKFVTSQTSLSNRSCSTQKKPDVVFFFHLFLTHL